MKKVLNLIEEKVVAAFESAGIDKKYARVALSNRPDLCEYQSNGAMPAAKEYKKAPIMIANSIVEYMKDDEMFEEVTAVNPGFINIKLNPAFVSEYINGMLADEERCGCDKVENPQSIVVDYGGANVAKPLHVGHLRPAIIGEAVKRITRFMGHNVVGDVHLGDWGLQLGLIICELQDRQPDLVYFDDNYTGEYPQEAPFTISDLEEIYPFASARSKREPEFKKRALQATKELQDGKPGYRAIFRHISNVSIADLKKNYGNLNVIFDLWYGESDADPYIAPMVERMIEEGYAYEDDGMYIVDVKKEGDKFEVPPCIIKKSDGASLYTTTDLATLVQREKDFRPDHVIYVVDKRQGMHFEQVFRTAKKTGIVREETKLTHIGFGTMNGADGKPFKTRDGGLLRLENLLKDIEEKTYERIVEGREVDEEEARKNAKIIALAALKYGDLSNQATKDYIFDIDRFISFEGDTGPYVLYTMVRMKSILRKYAELKGELPEFKVLPAVKPAEKALMLDLMKFNAMMEKASEETAPHQVCAYIHDLANSFNKFYHENNIMKEEDEARQVSFISLLSLTKSILEICIDVLGFEAPEQM